jgi:acetate kinase
MILSLNLGSSTLKAGAYQWNDGDANALPVRIGKRLDVPVAFATPGPGDARHADELVDRAAAVLPDATRAPAVVAHRIVHGGARSMPAELDDAVLAELARFERLAPLHQPAALQLARAARARWPGARHVAVFDTSWHASLADWSRRLPVPMSLHDAGVMRYGFHGLAFQSAMRQLERLDSGAGRQRVVLAHLGSGCSLCAVAQGRSVDTTMGMTPLDGLPMATRSGSLDPGVVLFMAQELGMSAQAIEQLLWRQSGQLGVSGRSGDMRLLLEATDPAAVLAVDQFVMRVAQGIAAMATSLGGIDALAFTGGIGTQSPVIRQRVVRGLGWTGLGLDATRNESGADRIDAGDSRARIWQVKVDEEYELALAGARLSGAPR